MSSDLLTSLRNIGKVFFKTKSEVHDGLYLLSTYQILYVIFDFHYCSTVRLIDVIRFSYNLAKSYCHTDNIFHTTLWSEV